MHGDFASQFCLCCVAYLAGRFDTSNGAEEDEYPGEQQAQRKVPLDDMSINVDTGRLAQHFQSTPFNND